MEKYDDRRATLRQADHVILDQLYAQLRVILSNSFAETPEKSASISALDESRFYARKAFDAGTVHVDRKF